MFLDRFTRNDALTRLTDFVPNASSSYARLRNFDLPGHPHISGLSPYVRHQIITEREILQAVTGRFSHNSAEKFIQEVYWRTYWKGWLELRPGVWDSYRVSLKSSIDQLQTQSGLRERWESACAGRTGIACLDHWAQELAQTGYLHNHARMWFASIWMFTLELPWELGADFFLRHLIDGDPASNTLSWRWVAGLQTQGKTYLARPDNIAKYTQGRFSPTGLAKNAQPLPFDGHPERRPLPDADPIATAGRVGLLITEDDLSPAWITQHVTPVAVTRVQTTASRSPLVVSDLVTDWVSHAMSDAATRIDAEVSTMKDTAQIVTWAQAQGLTTVTTSYPPTGPTKDALDGLGDALAASGIALNTPRRAYDSMAWPHATAGFFKFKSQIPKLLAAL